MTLVRSTRKLRLALDTNMSQLHPWTWRWAQTAHGLGADVVIVPDVHVKITGTTSSQNLLVRVPFRVHDFPLVFLNNPYTGAI